MTAACRFVAVDFSRNPLSNKGTTIASAGDSTDCTNVTPAILCIISGTSFGLVIAIKIFPVICSMSRFPMTSNACFMVSVEAFLTCFLVSHMHAVTSGTTSGRESANCLGATALKRARHFSASSRICHFFSTGKQEKMIGSSDFIANGQILSQIANAVSFAAAWTSLLLAIACSRQAPNVSLTKGCEVGTDSANSLTTFRAARASDSSFEAHRAVKATIPSGRPDFTTPSALTASTMEETSSIERFANFSSKDIL
mmetsp:Transcript_4535/g.11699  ORF Transcript_4535/g.11699 Transcript_4535/m.11699 type:complete len:255 (+) Transcript_4535:2448-3212(+)